ncbi:hypothetical protein RJ640_023549 [Escallonia rubra]|uniref:Uncharacterized protein n=1 Tax=Escallonia rubra TaxID=112253 RepID=A0AA88UNA8_9ASTE|nr:hypothetical protein RJ640_023549 [Escallonia rubra]
MPHPPVEIPTDASTKPYAGDVPDEASRYTDDTALMFDFNDVTKFEKEWEALLKRKFETVGILCGHALKVLDVLVIKYIPETFSRGGQEDEGLDIHRSEGLNISDRYRELWPDAVRLAHKASEFKDGYILYKTRMKELDKEIEELRKKHYEFMGHGCELNGSDGVDKNAIENLIGNVKGIKKRGGPPKRGGKRHKSWVEKQPRKRKQMMTNSLGCPNNDKENQDPLLHHEAGLDDNFLSSLSQGSNRIQSNDERVFGDFNDLHRWMWHRGGQREEPLVDGKHASVGRCVAVRSLWVAVTSLCRRGRREEPSDRWKARRKIPVGGGDGAVSSPGMSPA